MTIRDRKNLAKYFLSGLPSLAFGVTEIQKQGVVDNMSIRSFDPNTVSGHGIHGQVIAGMMYSALAKHKLGLSYDPFSKRFTILNSADHSIQTVVDMLGDGYTKWIPTVLEEVDSNGNRLAVLVSTPTPEGTIWLRGQGNEEW